MLRILPLSDINLSSVKILTVVSNALFSCSVWRIGKWLIIAGRMTHLRLARVEDKEAIADLETRVMHFPMGHRVREWLSEHPEHPTMTPDRIAVAETDGAIVAAAALVPEPFLYRGLPVASGVWDAVATDAAHRRAGLCRALMAFLEARHRPLLLLVEGATAVYRRLGYSPAFPNRGGCNSGGALLRVSALPARSDWTVRRAVPADAPWLAAFRRRVAEASLLAAAPSEVQWRHTLREDRRVVGPGETGLNRWQEVRVLVAPDGRDAGFFAHDPWDIGLLMELELLPGFNMRDAGSAVLHELAAFSGAEELKIALPDDHVLFDVFPLLLSRRDRGGSDWHARIPDATAFLCAVQPALEEMLSRSALANWTGELVLACGRESVRIRGREGSLEFSTANDEADMHLTENAFVRLALAGTPLAALMDEDRDVGGSDEAVALLSALFPAGRISARSI